MQIEQESGKIGSRDPPLSRTTENENQQNHQ